MSGHKISYDYTCAECSEVNTARGKALTLAMTCKKCGTYFYTNAKLNFKFLKKQDPLLALGSKGKIKGESYEVMSFTVKRENKYKYTWLEYGLFSPQHGVAFLSQNDGNWNFLKPYAKHPWMFGPPSTPQIDKGTFELYSKYRAEVLYASGEYFADIIDITEKSQHFEHINPPYILNFEQSNSRLGAYLGEYISPEQVASSFGLKRNQLPKKVGLGYTEPILFPFKQKTLVTVTLVSILLSTLVMLFFNNTALNKKVLHESYDQKTLGTQKMFVSKSFDLEGGTKNLEVRISAPLSNDWFFAEYSLINETTDEELIFTKELEFYHGTEGGYGWTEGSNESNAYLSSIPEGKYHINIYPEFSTTNHDFTIQVIRDVPHYSNYFILLIVLCIFPIALFYYKQHKEEKRWSESDYGNT
jgi:Domain of unknown function (DUF4178)